MFLGLVVLVWAISAVPSMAQISDGRVRILVLNDQSGPNAETGGPGSVEAARMAIEDFGGRVGNSPVELLVADRQNKPDIPASLARQFIDEKGVDAIVDVPVSSIALAVSNVVKEKDKTLLLTNTGSADLTGIACAPTTINWTYDSHMLAAGTASGAVERGLKKWFFITSDYNFGTQMQADATRVVEKAGGSVVGAVRHPPYAGADMSSYMLQAMTSSADVIALANGSGDTIRSIKQASEFGVTRSSDKHLAALLLYVVDVHALGLETAQGLILTAPFYWNQSPEARAWSMRYAARMGDRRPTFAHAGVYAAVLHYLKAVEAAGTDRGSVVVAKMKELPTNDPLFGKGTIRADGRKMHGATVYQVKTPAESKEAWDYYKPVGTISEDQAFAPMRPECNFVTHG